METAAPQDPLRLVGATVPWQDFRLDERRIEHLLHVSRLHVPPYTGDDGIGPLVPPTVLVAQRVDSERLGIPDAPAKLNGGNAFRWLAEVAPGEVLQRQSTIDDVTRKEGRTGLLDLYRIHTSYRRKADQRPVGEAEATTIRRYPAESPAGSPRESAGPTPEPHAAGEVFSVTPSSRDLVRYSAATDDFYEAHYDLEFARAAGLPGVLVHGLLKMAYLATAAVHTGGPGTVAARSPRPTAAPTWPTNRSRCSRSGTGNATDSPGSHSTACPPTGAYPPRVMRRSRNGTGCEGNRDRGVRGVRRRRRRRGW